MEGGRSAGSWCNPGVTPGASTFLAVRLNQELPGPDVAGLFTRAKVVAPLGNRGLQDRSPCTCGGIYSGSAAHVGGGPYSQVTNVG